jgi:hypothetical protein
MFYKIGTYIKYCNKTNHLQSYTEMYKQLLSVF